MSNRRPVSEIVRFSLVAPAVNYPISAAASQSEATVEGAVLYAEASGDTQAAVLMVDCDRGATITNVAGRLCAYLSRLYLVPRRVHWVDTPFLYRDTDGCWDKIQILRHGGGVDMSVSFFCLPSRSVEGALNQLVLAGLVVDDRIRDLARELEEAATAVRQ